MKFVVSYKYTENVGDYEDDYITRYIDHKEHIPVLGESKDQIIQDFMEWIQEHLRFQEEIRNSKNQQERRKLIKKLERFKRKNRGFGYFIDPPLNKVHDQTNFSFDMLGFEIRTLDEWFDHEFQDLGNNFEKDSMIRSILC